MALYLLCEHGGSGDMSKLENHLITRLPLQVVEWTIQSMGKGEHP